MNNSDSPLTPNLYPLIIECCRIEPDFDRLVSLASYIIDWDQVIKSSYAHGVFPLVAKSLKSIPYIPTDVRRLFKLTTIDIAQKNMRAASELIKVVEILKSEGIEVITFKGPALSQMAYGDIVSRQYGDLDILLDEKEIVRAVTLLNEAGYENILPLEVLRNQTCIDIIKDFTIVQQNNRVAFEVHWKLFEKKYAMKSFDQGFRNIETVVLNGYEVQTIGDELFLVYLCIHGSKHMWERLEWVCDIDRLIRNREFDWDKIVSMALLLHQSDGVFLGFALGRKLFDTPVPSSIEPFINTPRMEILMDEVVDAIENNLFDQNDFQRNKMIFLFQVRIIKTWLQKVMFFLDVFFGISPEDCQTFHLSDRWKYLYMILRPYRLMKKALAKVMRWL